MSLEIVVHAVLHLKVLINGQRLSGRQERGSMDSIHQAKVKSGHLLHEITLVQSQRNSTVCVNNQTKVAKSALH